MLRELLDKPVGEEAPGCAHLLGQVAKAIAASAQFAVLNADDHDRSPAEPRFTYSLLVGLFQTL